MSRKIFIFVLLSMFFQTARAETYSVSNSWKDCVFQTKEHGELRLTIFENLRSLVGTTHTFGLLLGQDLFKTSVVAEENDAEEMSFSFDYNDSNWELTLQYNRTEVQGVVSHVDDDGALRSEPLSGSCSF